MHEHHPHVGGEQLDSEAAAARTEQEPRAGLQIYVADLAAYNNGVLHGRWLDAARPVDEMQADVAELLVSSPEAGAEEWAIHDYNGFTGLRLGEHENLETISNLALGLHYYGEAFGHYAAWAGHNEVTSRAFLEAYRGQWDSLQDYVQELTSDAAEAARAAVPAGLQAYAGIDLASLARDLELNGDIWTAAASDGSGVHIYDGHAN